MIQLVEMVTSGPISPSSIDRLLNGKHTTLVRYFMKKEQFESPYISSITWLVPLYSKIYALVI